MRWATVLATGMALVLPPAIYGEVPRTISYQGVLKDVQGYTVPDGEYGITFQLYELPAGGEALWTEPQMLSVVGGVFNAVLGRDNPIGLEFDGPLWLGIKIDGEPELEPRVELTASPYAFRAAIADSVIGGPIAGIGGSGTTDYLPRFTASTTIGNSILYQSADRIGIGTTSPSCKLEVRGVSDGIRAMADPSMNRWIEMQYNASLGPVLRGSGYPRLTLDANFSGAGKLVLGQGGDKVGIGINDPTTELDVVGTVKMTGFRMPTGAVSGYVLTTDGSGIGSWQPGGGGSLPPGSSGQTLRHDGTTWVGTGLLYNDGTNVGIGTPAPTRLLDVEKLGAGPAGAQARVKEYSNDRFGSTLQLGKSRGGALGSDVMTQIGDTLGVVDGFGIDMGGMESAAARILFLQPGEGTPPFVPGSILFQTSDGYTSPIERMRITSGGRVGIGVPGPTRMLDVGQDALIRGPLDVQGSLNAQGALNVSGDASLQNRLDVGGGASVGDTLNMTGHRIANLSDPIQNHDAATKGYVDTAVSGVSGVGGTGTPDRVAKFTGSNPSSTIANSVLYESGGKIGVGATPVNTLDVEGALAVGASYSGANTAPANGMIVQGNVGIGVTGPGSRLEVKSSGNTTATSALHVKNSSGTSMLYVRDDGAVGLGTTSLTTLQSRLKVQGGVEVDDFIQAIDTGGLDLRTSTGTSGLYVDSNAKVGIGTSAPKNKLDVEGAVAVGSTYSGTNTGPNNGLIVEGSVGIGTPSPSYALDVAGEAGFDSYIRHNDDGNTYMYFSDDRIYLYAGGYDLFNINATVPHYVIVNSAMEDVDFKVESDTDANALFVQGSDGYVGIGTGTPGKKLDVNGTTRTKVLEITGGSDLAEPFAMSEERALEPGTVVVIDDRNPGKLRTSDLPYDIRVAGIVSGAGGVNPGLTLNQQDVFAAGQNVALTGRVWCKADASFGPIEPGDRLTTSTTPGHAMRVSDQGRAAGAVIGKAMTSLGEGRGLVLVLVQPQ